MCESRIPAARTGAPNEGEFLYHRGRWARINVADANTHRRALTPRREIMRLSLAAIRSKRPQYGLDLKGNILPIDRPLLPALEEDGRISPGVFFYLRK